MALERIFEIMWCLNEEKLSKGEKRKEVVVF
jgi:hypothetical protein